MSGQARAKVTARVEYDWSRPSSPTKTHATSSSPLPTARPKAKINSSATIGTRKAVASPSPSTLTPRSNFASPRTLPPRAPSPCKPPSGRAAQSTPAVTQVRAKVTRVNTPLASNVPSAPELRQRALTTTPADLSTNAARGRSGSSISGVSSHVSASPVLGPSRTLHSPPTLGVITSHDASSVRSGSGIGHVRVKSKVTKVAEHAAYYPRSVPTSPSLPPHTRPTRVPSISSLSLSPPLAHAHAAPTRSGVSSPTTSSPGHQRYPTTGQIHSPKERFSQSITPQDDSAVNYTGQPQPKVDPAHIPLPPLSPPTSTLSFSSRSSTSKSSSGDTRSSEVSGSTAPTLHSRLNGNGRTHSRTPSIADGLGIQITPSPISRELSKDGSLLVFGSEDDPDGHDEYDDNDSERKKRNEAKSNRKIADLEITNRSLLAINTSLESTKHRQAKEIRDLRRKLRESILVLPPPAYRQAKSSLGEDAYPQEVEEVEDEEDEAEEKALLEGQNDEAYRRVKTLLEALLESGRQALETKPSDFAGGGTRGTKVLSEEEARTWRGDDGDARSLIEDVDDAASISQLAARGGGSRPLTPSRVAIPDEEFISEDEVEASLTVDDTDDDDDHGTGFQLPPITVTPSPSL